MERKSVEHLIVNLNINARYLKQPPNEIPAFFPSNVNDCMHLK
jgi:hypothetical protein